jgi:hypothetical protein
LAVVVRSPTVGGAGRQLSISESTRHKIRVTRLRFKSNKGQLLQNVTATQFAMAFVQNLKNITQFLQLTLLVVTKTHFNPPGVFTDIMLEFGVATVRTESLMIKSTVPILIYF